MICADVAIYLLHAFFCLMDLWTSRDQKFCLLELKIFWSLTYSGLSVNEPFFSKKQFLWNLFYYFSCNACCSRFYFVFIVWNFLLKNVLCCILASITEILAIILPYGNYSPSWLFGLSPRIFMSSGHGRHHVTELISCFGPKPTSCLTREFWHKY